jgi:hypothetical protein
MNVLIFAAATGILLISGLFIAVAHRNRRSYQPEAVETIHHVHVITSVDAPNRNLAATLPRRTQAEADADRYFAYEGVRTPRYRRDMGPERAELLQPLQVVRVGSESERRALELSVPTQMTAIFVDDETTAGD